MLNHQFDEFNGIIIDPASLPKCVDTFSKDLATLLTFATTQQKAVIWITLPIVRSNLIPALTAQGFIFHTCLEQEITLIRKSRHEDIAPFAPTHSLGAGGLVQRDNGDVLFIKEKGATTFKLPGGHVELGEKVADAVMRETFEETGVYTSFQGILAMTSTHPYRFGKSNIYIVCKLYPETELINIQDPDEVEEARWMAPKEFLAGDSNSAFNKYLVKSLLGKQGLSHADIDLSRFSQRKHEVFLSR